MMAFMAVDRADHESAFKFIIDSGPEARDKGYPCRQGQGWRVQLLLRRTDSRTTRRGTGGLTVGSFPDSNWSIAAAASRPIS